MTKPADLFIADQDNSVTDEYSQQQFSSKPDTALAERIVTMLKEKKFKAKGEQRGLDQCVLRCPLDDASER